MTILTKNNFRYVTVHTLIWHTLKIRGYIALENFLQGHMNHMFYPKKSDQSQQVMESADYKEGSTKASNSVLRHAQLCTPCSEGYFEQHSVKHN
jgi:hypothetical protein